jgi:hypothetical protein
MIMLTGDNEDRQKSRRRITDLLLHWFVEDKLN